jgi:hypothetical protein
VVNELRPEIDLGRFEVLLVECLVAEFDDVLLVQLDLCLIARPSERTAERENERGSYEWHSPSVEKPDHGGLFFLADLSTALLQGRRVDGSTIRPRRVTSKRRMRKS